MKLPVSLSTRFCFFVLVGWWIVAANLDLLSCDYPGFIRDLPAYGTATFDETNYLFFYKLVRVLALCLLAIYWFVLIDITGARRYKLSIWLDTLCGKLDSVMAANKRFFLQLTTATQIIFLVWLFLLIRSLLIIPFNYDEIWSNRFFVHEGWVHTITYYPLPNNHIFYNFIACFFSVLPLKAEIANRLPSLLASIVTAFYFLKLCRRYFPPGLSVFLTYDQDILIVHPSKGVKDIPQLANYRLMGSEPGLYALYIKNK